ncbi:YpjP family protein [Aquibacillus salsiterrae]|uniref:YpjP family protein n=1 Tax=Aquibacillus salsiterrae TaxID=2950439 RepID=A0A9X4AGI5_9BACI|nr:YpjP family protein [Aquibacillus salsiterrae]MDC3417143.1 YpjP family protein [Aquibacillus salsiterrae]
MMKLWIRKAFVVIITFMTLGIYIPPTYLNAALEKDGLVSEKPSDNRHTMEDQVVVVEEAYSDVEELDETDSIINTLTEQARMQAISKLGPRIVNQVEEDLLTMILPNIEEVIATIMENADEEERNYFAVSENPTPGYGEKIFHLYDVRTEKDIARFHVRRENRPGEGYWFNFHYHLEEDGFEEHRAIGEVFWDKNTPPKWMA